MSNEQPSLRLPPVKTDEELLAEMGTDPSRWAVGLHDVLPGMLKAYDPRIARAWFHHAIEAGRKAAQAECPKCGGGQ